jgi:hypothetical protein
MSRKPAGDRLVMSPKDPLAAEGPAEAFARPVRQRLDRLSMRKSRVMSVEVPARHAKRERA